MQSLEISGGYTGTVASTEAAQDALPHVADETFNTWQVLEKHADDAAASALSGHLPPLPDYV